MGIDYDALRGATGGPPPDGEHDAYLDRAALVDTRNGSMLVTEWKTRGEEFYAWTTWFGFEGQRMGFTQDFLDQLGIDRSTLTSDDALTDALEARVGLLYRCATEAWGSAGGINVEVLGEAGQQRLDSRADAPIDTGGLGPTEYERVGAEHVEVGAGAADDDDIPF
jgi:hypothetical protein